MTDINNDELCLVSTSGGLDSSLTLAILKLAGYENIKACYFNYGHRGSWCEQTAITNVTKELGIELKVFDLTTVYKNIEVDSMLTDENAEVTTGTSEGLKRVDAWVPGRNMMFLTTMATYAESLVMKYGYKKVSLLGGFLNLSESGHYPDNSEYFLSSALEFFKYGTLIGNRIEPLYCLSNLMKHELFVLIKHLKLEDVYRHTISCDRPKMFYADTDEEAFSEDYPRMRGIEPRNCSHNGIPACGSGLLSYWASKMVGMDDMGMRKFYDTEDGYIAHKPEHLDFDIKKDPDPDSIINRILLPLERLEFLKKNLG